jgi:hypothetical protein
MVTNLTVGGAFVAVAAINSVCAEAAIATIPSDAANTAAFDAGLMPKLTIICFILLINQKLHSLVQ